MKIFCCCRRNHNKNVQLKNNISLQLSTIKQKDNKDSSSMEINQSQSMDSNNLNNSTKEDIILRTNKLNILPKIGPNIQNLKKNDNLVKCNNVIYNIIKMDNINNMNNKNRKNIEKEKELNNKDKILTVKEKELINKDNELSEREKKLFEKENELSNKEKEINKIMALFQRNKKINNENGSKQIQKNNIINDVIKYKKVINNNSGNKINNNNLEQIKKVEKKQITEIII